jgi:hypothetical protein
VRSDKLLVLLRPEALQKEFGHTNLLIVGSLAVNWAARVANKASVFRYAISPEREAWSERFMSRKDLNDRDVLRFFWKLAQVPSTQNVTIENIDEVARTELQTGTPATKQRARDAAIETLTSCVAGTDRLQSASEIMDEFRKPGFLDPADWIDRGSTTGDWNDFGMVSLAPNPFAVESDRYVSILVGGVHGPGTAHALRVLAQHPQEFQRRPFGGVLEVFLDGYMGWSNRFQNATWEWRTGEYSPETVVEHFEAALQRDPAHTRPHAIQERLQFVRKMMGGQAVTR